MIHFFSKTGLLSAGFLLMVSCAKENKEAKLYLEGIRVVYQNGEYETAKQKIDSIQVLYPKAFEQIKEGIALLQDVRRAQSIQQITVCDSLITFMEAKTDSLKNSFIYDINKDYQETGRYLPKGLSSNPLLTTTMLRSGVSEDGKLFLESVFVGGNQYHNQVNISTKDGFFVETLPVNDEGMNFRFTDGGKQYEVIKFSGIDENGVARFIYAHADEPLTVNLKGKNTLSFPLSKASQKEISDSYLLSEWMLKTDSLKVLKEKSELSIRYLDLKNNNPEAESTLLK